MRVRRRGGSSERGLLERGAAASARLRQTKRRRGSARLHQRTHAAELEKKARGILKTLYESGLEEPLAGAEDGPAKLLPFLVDALEDIADGLGPTVEAEARALSSAALTHVLSHVYLRDPNVDFDSLLEPVSGDRAAAAAEAVRGRAEVLLGKFRSPSVLPGRGAAGLATSRGEAVQRDSTTGDGVTGE